MRCARIFCVEGTKILTSKMLGQGLEHLQVQVQVVRSAQQSVRHLFNLSSQNPIRVVRSLPWKFAAHTKVQVPYLYSLSVLVRYKKFTSIILLVFLSQNGISGAPCQIILNTVWEIVLVLVNSPSISTLDFFVVGNTLRSRAHLEESSLSLTPDGRSSFKPFQPQSAREKRAERE